MKMHIAIILAFVTATAYAMHQDESFKMQNAEILEQRFKEELPQSNQFLQETRFIEKVANKVTVPAFVLYNLQDAMYEYQKTLGEGMAARKAMCYLEENRWRMIEILLEHHPAGFKYFKECTLYKATGKLNIP